MPTYLRVEGVTSRIKRFLSSIKYGTLFSTRELLGFGKRAAVDMALCRMNRRGDVTRLANGIYYKSGARDYKFTPWEIAAKKAQAFGKQIIRLSTPKSHLLRKSTNSVVAFATTGASSSFRFGELTIQFVGSAPRKVMLSDEPSGIAARDHWDKGLSACLAEDKGFPRELYDRLRREQRFKLLDMFMYLPAWINDGLAWKHLYEPRPRPKRFTEWEVLDTTEIRLKNQEREKKELAEKQFWLDQLAASGRAQLAAMLQKQQQKNQKKNGTLEPQGAAPQQQSGAPEKQSETPQQKGSQPQQPTSAAETINAQHNSPKLPISPPDNTQ